MRTSRKAIVLLMAGAMLLAATTGAFAQGYGRKGGSRATTPGYDYTYGYGRNTTPQAVPGTVLFGYGPRGGFDGMRMMGSGGYGALYYSQYQKLSTEDKAKVEKIMEDSTAQVVPLQNEVRIVRLDLNNLLWSESPDKAKIDADIAKIADLQKKIQEIRTNAILEVNAIFRAAQ